MGQVRVLQRQRLWSPPLEQAESGEEGPDTATAVESRAGVQLAGPTGSLDGDSGHLPGTPVAVVTQMESLDSVGAVESWAGGIRGRGRRHGDSRRELGR